MMWLLQEDRGWEWERLFVDVSSDIQKVWGRKERQEPSQPQLAKTDSTP